jgi:branched-chain amino acid transport system substrate-binding protein
VSENPKGAVLVVGNDSFCAAAFNGLRTAGFKGKVVAIQECITDVTRNAVPGDFLEGITVGATTPFADKTNPSIVQYLAVLDEYGESGADREANNGLVAFIVASSLAIAAKDLKGPVNPASVTKAIKAMSDSEMPGTGGQHFRCNGKADPNGRAICAASAVLYTTLDDEGNITAFRTLGADPAAK